MWTYNDIYYLDMNIFQNFAAIKQLVDEIWITRSLAITPRNWLEFYFQYKDIFYSREYHFVARSQNPFIIDCGANIGVSIAYFKKIYPKCRILAFEPNPVTFQLLRQNMKRNRFKNVKLIEAALDSHGGKATLYSDSRSWWNGSWADSIQAHKSQHAAYEVKTIALSPYITQTVDLLKLDIEGMEGAVFSEIAPKLQYV